MSLTTAFPFQSFIGDLKTRKTMEDKTAVSLSLLSSEDMARMGFVEVRTRSGAEERIAPWLPIMHKGESYATFYDTRMGNFDVRRMPPQSCTTCANSLTGKYGNERCQGHFGYIRMPRRYPQDPSRHSERMFVINPHMADEVEQLLQAECFFCHRFRAPAFDVERYRLALELIDAGLIGEALHLLDTVLNSKDQGARNRRRRDANEDVINDLRVLMEHVARILQSKQGTLCSASGDSTVPYGVSESLGNGPRTAGTADHGATSKPAMDVRNKIGKQALRELREYVNICSHCQGVSPRITSKNGQLYFHFNKRSAEYNVAHGTLSQAQLREWEENNRRQNRTHTYFYTADVREHVKALCQHESSFLAAVFPRIGQPSVSLPFSSPLPPNMLYKVCFLDKLLVPPLPLRLASGVQVSESGHITPDAHTKALSDVLGYVEQVEMYNTLKGASAASGQSLVTPVQEIANEYNLRNLQAQVTNAYKAILESFASKHGLFRMHMMGKRVNQACRSVISPDYLIEPNEALLPRAFAKNVTYPEQVCSYSSARTTLLKRCVVNGTTKYPGASHLEVRLSNGEVRCVDLNVPEQTRRQHAMKYFAMAQTGTTLIVHRHILDGDRLIFNRQPTLHKVSMMGYRAKVLSGLKTLRFHYINGKSYNADFDGDEMNIHVPQSIEAKAELECLMDANLNYLVPTSGKPIRGLIQDHIAAGVLLTLRDKFLDRDTFIQYVYNGLWPYMRMRGGQSHARASLSEMIPVPALLKPGPLWTGKQLISVIVRYVTGVVNHSSGNGAKEGVTVRGMSLIQPSSYATTDAEGELTKPSPHGMDDSAVLFQNSELLTGVMCKNQLGPTNLSVGHIIHELYGPHMVSELFGAFGRVLTMSLQREGFSMGMDDMGLVEEGRRAALLRELDNAPLGLPEDESVVMPHIMGLATALQSEYVPGRMLLPFPANQLLMMTLSGAKGSNTNAIQMSLGLGQQLFDGRRVDRMNSGKTMPPFFIGERRARSFGYAMGRFASGIRPAEYTIHAMAGRDGLIDTAVKTSRSGYLQRCLIKGLESLVVHWDHSVRDSNGSVIQFTYGGDGLDPMKASTLKAWEMVKENIFDLSARCGVETRAGSADGDEFNGYGKRLRMDEEAEARKQLLAALVSAEAARDPLPRHLQHSLHSYLHSSANFTLFRKVSQVARWEQQRSVAHKLHEKKQESIDYYNDIMAEVTTHRRLRAFCDPGEPVGLLAAQAAGEPSTQMTLNTFHSAGSTVTHVTEGIPRLRELLIYASVKKAAVVVPVEAAGEVDEVCIARALQAGVATKLEDCLARGPSEDGDTGRGYCFHVERTVDGIVLTVALLFSKSLLEHKREAMCMSSAEHLQSFTGAIRQFAKNVIAALRGRTEAEKEAGAGLVHTSVQDPMELAGAAEGAESEDENMMGDHDINDDDSSTQHGTPAVTASHVQYIPELDMLSHTENKGPGSRTVSDEDEEAGAPERSTPKKELTRDDDDENDDFVAGACRAVSYDNFENMHGVYGKSKFLLDIAPLHPTAAARDGVVPLPPDLFIVNVSIRMPHSVVAVIPDVLRDALRRQVFPTWLPQFESVSFTRKADDSRNGELVFQGPTATVKNVSSFLSLFTVRAKAVKVRKARSTDIQDMCTSIGVEAAYKGLYDELDKLFRRYAVDYHHLSLIADTATNRGIWENFNFAGVISHSASPLFQMTFASSKTYLHTALTRGIGDELQSISSAIMVGERPRVGTACVKVMQDPRVLRDVVERQFA